MRVLISMLVLTFGLLAVAEERTECVTFNGTEYCTTVTILKIGEVEVPLNDPLSALNAAKKNDVQKIGLWDHYKYPAIITELARQVNMTEDLLIMTLGNSGDPNWEALYELTMTYDQLSSNLLNQIGEQNVDRLFRSILNEITSDIIEQLSDYDGLQLT